MLMIIKMLLMIDLYFTAVFAMSQRAKVTRHGRLCF